MRTFEQAKAFMVEAWNLENHRRPAMFVTAPKKDRPHPRIAAPATLEERWLDVDAVVVRARKGLENTYYAGEALPIFNPNLGPDMLGAFLGCELVFGEETSWATHPIDDLNAVEQLRFEPDNFYYKKVEALTLAALEDANGDYLVGLPDLHTGLDALVSLRGPENLCYDVLECPNTVKRLNWQIFDVFQQVYDRLYGLISARQGGTTNWMRVWHPQRWFVTSCDFSCLISAEHFNELALPEIAAEIDCLDASLYHLDGPDALRHLPALLSIEKLKGIQWVPGSGREDAREWLDVLRQIQAAGKMIHMSVRPEELEALCKALRPEGLMLACHCDSEEEADTLIERVEGYY